MVSDAQRGKANALRELHEAGIFALPNAWDAGSAALIARAGAKAIATTSAGMSWAWGRPDGQNLTRDEMAHAVARIVDSVELPVTADIEGGYGPSPEDVAATVAAIIGVGAVGINLEDSGAPGGSLFEPSAQAERISAARRAAAEAGLSELLINVRTDVYLFGIGEPEGRFDDVLARASCYAEAGADCLFVPGLTDLDVLANLVAKVSLPINVMAGPGAPSVAEFQLAGVRRVSLGQAIVQAAYTLARKASVELIEQGTYDAIDGADPFPAINGVFTRP
jgi:2-methylisocitrate lyase-like PEP mutase family enzyme